MLQTDPFTVAPGWCGRRDRMCWGEAWAFVATQPTGPEPWPLTLHPGGQTKLWVTSETRHSVGRECLDTTQITPLTLQKRFMAFYSLPANFQAEELHQSVKNNQAIRGEHQRANIPILHGDKQKSFIINERNECCD